MQQKEPPNRLSRRLIPAALAVTLTLALAGMGIIRAPVLYVVLCLTLVLSVFLLASRRATAVKITVALVSCGLTILAADLGLRLFGEELLYYRPHDMLFEYWTDMPLTTRYRKNSVYSGESYGDLAAMSGNAELRQKRRIVFETDSFGFRNSRQLESDIPYDLIMLGDSFGVGNGTTQDRTFVSLLRSTHNLKVYNLSMPGSPWQSLVNLAAEMDRLQTRPGTVILFAVFAGNDLDDHYYNPNVSRANLPWASRREALVSSFRAFRRRSPVYRLMNRSLFQIPGNELVHTDTFADGSTMLFFKPHIRVKDRTESQIRQHPNCDRLFNCIRRIARIADAYDCVPRIMLIPSKAEVYSWLLDDSPDWTTTAEPSGFALVLEDFCRQNGLAFLDLKPPLVTISKEVYNESRSLLWWSDDTHWNETGHEVVAEIIYQALSATEE